MSELSKLVGKGKIVKIGEVELNIKPLTVNSLPLLMELSNVDDKKRQAEAMIETVKATLIDSVPDATEEEIDKISVEHLTKIMEAIMSVNKIEEMDDQKKEFLERIKNEQRPGTTGN